MLVMWEVIVFNVVELLVKDRDDNGSGRGDTYSSQQST